MTSAPAPVHNRRLPSGGGLVALATGVAVAAVVAAGVVLIRADVFAGSQSHRMLQGSGIPAAQLRHVGRFATIELAGTNDVTVTGGSRRAVTVTADSNLLGHVTTEVWDGRLLIGTVGSFTTRTRMHVAVSVPTVRAIVLSGSGAVTAREIDSPELTLTLSGSGILRAVGAVERLEVSLGGSGDAVLDRLQARDVRARLSGSGRILVQATRSLDASVPGTGTIVYIGDPAHVRTSVTGTGVVARG